MHEDDEPYERLPRQVAMTVEQKFIYSGHLTSRNVVAIHESAHAVVAFMNGERLGRVCLRKQPDWPPLWIGSTSRSSASTPPDWEVERLLAGAVAAFQSIGWGNSPFPYEWSDQPQHDYTRAWALAREVLGPNASSSQLEDWLEERHRETIALLRRKDVWSAVVAVATTLERRNRLEGRFVLEVIRETGLQQRVSAPEPSADGRLRALMRRVRNRLLRSPFD
jgi:hypothetical protein